MHGLAVQKINTSDLYISNGDMIVIAHVTSLAWEMIQMSTSIHIKVGEQSRILVLLCMWVSFFKIRFQLYLEYSNLKRADIFNSKLPCVIPTTFPLLTV